MARRTRQHAQSLNQDDADPDGLCWIHGAVCVADRLSVGAAGSIRSLGGGARQADRRDRMVLHTVGAAAHRLLASTWFGGPVARRSLVSLTGCKVMGVMRVIGRPPIC